MSIKDILSNYKTIAVYGMSKNPVKPSFEVPIFMKNKGYDIIPVNPSANEIEGMKCYHSLQDIPDSIEILNIFRPSEVIPEIIVEALERKKQRGDIKVIWLQLGIVSDEAKRLAEDSGIEFIQDKCIKMEYERLM